MGFSQFLHLLGLPPAPPTLAALGGRAPPSRLLLLSILLPALCACFLSDILAPTNDDTQLDDLPPGNALSLALPHWDTIWGILSNFPCFFFLLNVLIVSLVFTSGILASSFRGSTNGSHLPEAVESNTQTAADLIDGMHMPFGLVFDEINSHIEASITSVNSDVTDVGGHYRDPEEERCNCSLVVHQQPAFASCSVNSHQNARLYQDALEEKPSPCRSYICSDQSVIMRMEMVMHMPSDERTDDDHGSQCVDGDPVDGDHGHDEDEDNGEHHRSHSAGNANDDLNDGERHDGHSAGNANDDLHDGGITDRYLNVTDNYENANDLNDGAITDNCLNASNKYLHVSDLNDDLTNGGIIGKHLDVPNKCPDVDAANAHDDGGDAQCRTMSTECEDEHHDATIETELQLIQPVDHVVFAMPHILDAEECKGDVRGGEETRTEHGPGTSTASVEECGGQRRGDGNEEDAMDWTKKEVVEEVEEEKEEEGMSTEELNARADAFILAFRRKLLLTAKEEED